MPIFRLPLAGRFPAVSAYYSMAYMVMFLPLTLIVYSITPRKLRKYALLLASYGFYWLVSGELLAVLLLETLSIFAFGKWLGALGSRRDEQVKAAAREERKGIRKKYLHRMRLVVLLAMLVHFGLLLLVKYSGFFAQNINQLFGAHLRVPRFIQPLGISFFTLQAAGYILDVYRGSQKADGNIGRLALFMAFFPCIVEGPICRYGETAQQLWEVQAIRGRDLKRGVERILWGMLKVVVVATRLNGFVEAVFDSPGLMQGGQIALAAVLYTIQLYMDFSGVMDAVAGTAEIFGVKLPENFEQPFFSRSIQEFWTRWHRTLGAWLRDYVFYSVTTAKGIKKLTGAARKKLGNHFGPLLAGAIALLCVWLMNGLWHGAGWNFIFFGLYHFALILLGSAFAPAARAFHEKTHIPEDSRIWKAFQRLRTALLVVVGELFFRAPTLTRGFQMLGRIFSDPRLTSLDVPLRAGLMFDGKDLLITGVSLLIVAAVGVAREKKIDLREALEGRRMAVRWIVLYALILFILVFGAYGKGYMQIDPMYANF